MVSGAVLLVMAVRVRSKASFGPAELPLMVLALLTPAILLARPGLLSSAAPVVYGLLLLSLSRSKPASGSVAPGGGATLSALSP
jgi:hypothetical protein